MYRIHQQQGLTSGVRAPRLLAGLLFLALLCAQITYASHQFDHASTDIGETCAECLLLDRSDDVITVAEAHVAQGSPILPVADFSVAAQAATRILPFRQRAPPLD